MAALEVLCDLGVLTRADASSASVRDLSRAHPVWGVRCADGRRLVVKGHARERGFDLGIEFLVYRMAAWCPALASVLPEAVVVDEDRHVLVLVDLGAASLAVRAGFAPQLGLPGTAPADPRWLADIAGRLGAALGGLHRGTAGLPLPPARPPVALAGLSGVQRLAGPPGEVCASLASEPVFADAARLLADPVPGCLVSHDMKWDNVIVRPDSTIALLDWELAGLGDPAVDVGFLLAEHLVRGGLDDAGRRLLAGYAETARPRSGAVPALSHRIALAAGLRIGQLAVEVADSRPAAVAPLTALARDVLTDADRLAREVSACLS